MKTMNYELKRPDFDVGNTADSNTGMESDVFSFVCVALRQKQLCSDLKAALSWASKIPMEMDLEGRKAFLVRARSGVEHSIEEFADNQQLLGRLLPEVTEYREMIDKEGLGASVGNLAEDLEPVASEKLPGDNDETFPSDMDGPDLEGISLDDDSEPSLDELFDEIVQETPSSAVDDEAEEPIHDMAELFLAQIGEEAEQAEEAQSDE